MKGAAEPSCGGVAASTSDDASTTECSICLQHYVYPVQLPDCAHIFCFLCVKGVVSRNGKCPMCRHPVSLKVFDRPDALRWHRPPLTSTNPEKPSSSVSETVDNLVASCVVAGMRRLGLTDKDNTTAHSSSATPGVSNSATPGISNSATTDDSQSGKAEDVWELKKEQEEATNSKTMMRELCEEGGQQTNTCYWFYEGRNEGWWRYDERTEVELETAYSTHCGHTPVSNAIDEFDTDTTDNADASVTSPTAVDFLIAGHIYVIDFDRMLQYRRDGTGRKRRMKRETQLGAVRVKGIAGLANEPQRPPVNNVAKTD